MTSYELDTALSLQKDAFAMGDCLHTSSENLSKLVRWAHSHGTICSLIPGLKHLLTDGAHGSLVAMWGCGAGHAYHWPLSAPCRPGQKERAPCYPDGRGVPGEPPPGVQLGSGAGERFLARSAAANKAKSRGGGDQTRDSLCDFSNGSEASETGDDNAEEFGGNLFDMACESSVTDEDGEYESEPPGRRRRRRSRGAPPLLGGTEDRAVKRIKQETPEHYYPVAQLAPRTDSDPRPGSSARGASLGHKPPSGDCPAASSSSSPLSSSPLLASLGKQSRVPPSPRRLEQSRAPCPGLTNQEENRPADASPAHLPPGLGSEELLKAGLGAELIAEHALGSSDSVGEAAAGPAPGEMERLRTLLQAERSRSALMGQTISSLEQDKQLLQQELTKKAELICDFLQDQLRPEKRRSHPSSQEPGSSHMVPFVEEAAFDSPVLFDSFEEVELHPLDRQRGLKTKRNRDGENTRVRMKNVVGVIARYMASLQEFRRSVSMKVAFDRVGVDRNTISRTAAIAELSLAAPEVFHALAPWDEKEETLAHYSHRCRQAMDDNIKAKIKSMKAKGDLLPIVSK